MCHLLLFVVSVFIVAVLCRHWTMSLTSVAFHWMQLAIYTWFETQLHYELVYTANQIHTITSVCNCCVINLPPWHQCTERGKQAKFLYLLCSHMDNSVSSCFIRSFSGLARASTTQSDQFKWLRANTTARLSKLFNATTLLYRCNHYGVATPGYRNIEGPIAGQIPIK